MVSLPESLRRPIECLVIDNFDSFTWNLYQSLSLLGIDVTVIRNDAIDVAALPRLDIKRLIISPGPGHPRTDSGISREAVRYFMGKVPILGVCMGLEAIVDVFGGEIGYAGEIKHGKLSPIRHDGRGIFNGLPQSFQSTRYHSLSASVRTVPDVLAITAATEESGVIMGVRHRQYSIEAVQYHPESVLSEEGDTLLRNFLNLRGGTWEENPSARVTDLSLPPFPIDGPTASNGMTPAQQKSSNKLPTILEKIHVQRLKDIEEAKNTPGTSMEDLETLLAMNLSPPAINLVERLRTTGPENSPALMAEIKRASPSKGPIALRANAAQQALDYALAGASVVSVLTEPHWFKGSLLDMRLARQAIDTLPNRPAVLRKDFIVDEYQIAEARLHGADTILLIVALLPIHRLKALYTHSRRLGMEPLVEVNNDKEMIAALELGAKVIGVNNRNLHSFEVDMGTTSRLASLVREKQKEGEVILCALSGISKSEDVKAYAEQGVEVQAVLIGEALMRAQDTKTFIRNLLGWSVPEETEGGEEEEEGPPLVKICGIRTVDEALTAAQAGADMLGLNFVPTSKRRIALDVACRIAHAIRERRTQAEAEIPIVSAEATSTKESKDASQTEKNLPWFATHANWLAKTLRAGHARPQLVGVFQDQPLSYILSVIASVQLDIVQLHGTEPLHWSTQLPVPVIRAFHVSSSVGDGSTVSGVEGITRPGLHQFVLLDAMREDGKSGGSGKVVDWELARRVVEAGEVGPSPFSPFPTLSSSSSPSVPSISAPRANGEPNVNANGISNTTNGLVSPPPTTTSSTTLSSPTTPTPTHPPSSTQSQTQPDTSVSPKSETETGKLRGIGRGRLPIILAGGLTPSNVSLAIERVKPWAVDVSGGVERSSSSSSISTSSSATANSEGLGKDLEKVVAFVRAVKGVQNDVVEVGNDVEDVNAGASGAGAEEEGEERESKSESKRTSASTSVVVDGGVTTASVEGEEKAVEVG
ncbi:IGPS-domain-containing protein [Fomitiporia mediterranea MF3/22]|uniref:IGPS-domain-containing protein n=1 Tax=Fomitiporia mediterranea (strain MF3/22) TaxID=694068 RepID=UPI0004408E24|nr:IGPS-domain-containing protein [Fomitiporia mediterranea MF3/22]EJD07993.1 IGPS-domain-containing protein [Fomitiporia mediterranea MF3/22]